MDYFEYIGFCHVKDLIDSQNNYQYPKPWHFKTKTSTLISRVIHQLFDTHGRSMFFPSHLSVGCVIQK